MQNTDHLAQQIYTLAAQINAATSRLLALIAEFDAAEGWGADGCASCAHWLNWKCGVGMNAAREKVRVARALAELPKIRTAFAEGRVSYSKVRAMTRVATPENEDYLLMIAEHGTAAHVETLVRASRQATAEMACEQANAQHANRALEWWSEDDGSMVIRVRVCAEDGARLLKAIESERERLRAERPRDDVSAETPEPVAALRADALIAALTGRPDTELQVHVSAETLRDDTMHGECRIVDGPSIAPETARRLGCDCGVVSIGDDTNGEPLGIGRRSRSIPPAIRRALEARDARCRFPGCSATRHLHGHHIVHWAHGGETALDNLVLLCSHHHRLVHEGGFDVTRRVDGTLRFIDRDGEPLVETPPSVRVDPDHALPLPAVYPLSSDDTRMDLAMAVDGYLSASGLPLDA